MDSGNWFVLIIVGVLVVLFIYNLGKNAGKAILFIQNLVKQILKMNRQEKP